MTTLGKIFTIMAIPFFIGAGLAWHHYLQLAHTINGGRWDANVLETPIRLEQGVSVSQPFTVNIATRYWLDIECQKAISSNAIDAALSKELAVEFNIASNAVIVVSGDSLQSSNTNYANNFIVRRISEFQAYPDTRYDLVLHVIHSVPILASMRSNVKISINPHAIKNLYVGISVSEYKAIGLALLGFYFSFPPFSHLASLLRTRKK
jgi:hypothetical protein